MDRKMNNWYIFLSLLYMNPLQGLKHWFIGDYFSKTDDVFERFKILLLYNYSFFYFVAGLFFYVTLFLNGLWYHFFTITFAALAILLIPFILKKTNNYKIAGQWFVIQQTIVSSANIFIQESKPDMSSGPWVITFITFVLFLFGPKKGLWLTLIYLLFTSLTRIIYKISGVDIPDSQQLPNNPLAMILPLALCVYIVWLFVKTRTEAEKQINEQKFLLTKNNTELEAQKRDSVSSINYARRIQYAVLPLEENIYRNIPLSFILYKPKDIVSGDFYWFHELDKDNYILACGDCTGHGVPGALMTVIGSNLLNQIVIEKNVTQPSFILTELDKQISQSAITRIAFKYPF